MAQTDREIKMSFKPAYIPLSRIMTRNFCKPNELPHYSFCKSFFEANDPNIIIDSSYNKWMPKEHIEYFIHYPSNLGRSPIWWELPWAGFNKLDTHLEKEALEEGARTRCKKYHKLLSSIFRQGFNFKAGPLTPVQLLFHNDQYIAIQQGSHHRLVTLDYLIRENRSDFLKSITFNNEGDALVPCQILLCIERSDLANLQTVSGESKIFSIEDALKWFDLGFDILGFDKKYSPNQLFNSQHSIITSGIYELVVS
jgi:hypothetical protein